MVDKTFFSSQSGAITVEQSVVVAGVIGLVIATFSAIKGNTDWLAGSAVAQLNGDSIANSNFETVPERAVWMGSTAYRVYGSVDGWNSVGSRDDRITFAMPGHQNGRYVTDLGHGHAMHLESNYAAGMTKTYDNLTEGTTYSVSFTAADLNFNNAKANGIEVMMGGEVIGKIDKSELTNRAETFSFDYTASGSSADLYLRSTGARDTSGPFVGNVDISYKTVNN